MKKIRAVFIMMISAQMLSAQNSKLSLYAQDLLLDAKQQAHYVLFKDQYRVSSEQVKAFVSSLLFSGNGTDLSEMRRESDALGFTHIRYQVTFDGLPVTDHVVIAHIRENKLQSINGELGRIEAPHNAFSISEEQALKRALIKVGAQKYKWENKAEEAQMAAALNDPNFSYAPKATRVIIEKEGVFYNAYQFNIYAELPLYRANVFVDGTSGNVIDEQNLICTSNVPASGATKYSGVQSFTCDFNGSSYNLKETGRGLGVETYNLNNSTTYVNTNFVSSSTTWSPAPVDQGALDAHWGAEKTYDYYMIQHNRNSVNNAGYKLVSYVHYSNNYQNAFWDGQRMTYGDGGGSYKIFTTLDICGHEISHGVTGNSAALNYSNESGALNESYSDIFGSCIENYSRPTNWNWKIGEDMTTSGNGLRNMSNPNLFGDPDTYGGSNWYTGTADNGGVHTNSGVSNFWFYLLTAGGSGTNDLNNAYSVSGLGFTTAGQIAYRALTTYYTPTTNYATARNLSIQAAKDLFGDCSNEMIQTINAWHAVGIGNKFVATVGANFNGDAMTFCALPATVNFTNLTPYAFTYAWDFGDGSVATSTNAQHSYTTNGTYSVKLKATGCNNVSDSLIKTAYVVVNVPPSPTPSMAVGCANAGATLNAVGANNIKWYSDAAGTNLIGTGSQITTAPINSSTTFYVANAVPNTPAVGGIMTQVGGGYLNNSNQWLYFDVVQNCTLNTVVVNAGGAGTRTIELRDANNVTINSVPFVLTQGQNTLNLYFPLTVGQNYRLALASGSANLYRTISGVSYPYNVGGCVNITNSSVGSSSYFWFYKWEVTKEDCQSPLVPVNVNVNPAPSVTLDPVATLVCSDDLIQLTGQPAGGIFTGAGVVGNSFIGNTLAAGNHTITYTYFDNSGCPGADSKVVETTACTGLSSITEFGMSIFPNPFSTAVVLISNQALASSYAVLDLAGRVISQGNITSGNQTIDLSELSSGIYFLNLHDGGGQVVHIEKILKE